MVDKLPLIMAVGAVLDFKAKHPNAIDDEVMQHVVLNIHGQGQAGAVAIAGANSALKFLRRNPKATKKEIMQAVMDQSNELAGNISAEEDFE